MSTGPLNPQNFHPGLSVDCVIFGFHKNELKVLLLKYMSIMKWALPGGFVQIDEDVDHAAITVLKQRTGLKNIFLTQFHLFGEFARSNKEHVKNLIEHLVITPDLSEWFSQRFVTLAYYALVEFSKVPKPKPDHTSDSCEWHSMNQLPDLILDHKIIVAKAYQSLKLRLKYQPIGLNLLPKRFTMPELQSLYETLLGRQLDRRNFQRKMLGYGILKKTGEQRTGGAHKAPFLYEFDISKYNTALSEGFGSTW